MVFGLGIEEWRTAASVPVDAIALKVRLLAGERALGTLATGDLSVEHRSTRMQPEPASKNYPPQFACLTNWVQSTANSTPPNSAAKPLCSASNAERRFP